jgi:hypothetical protein
MTDNLITPPPELINQWKDKWFDAKVKHIDLNSYLINEAARWGADQELEACCEWLECNYNYPEAANPLRTARRPTPPSLKEQALGALYAIATGADDTREFYQDIETIKTAPEQLDD